MKIKHQDSLANTIRTTLRKGYEELIATIGNTKKNVISSKISQISMNLHKREDKLIQKKHHTKSQA